MAAPVTRGGVRAVGKVFIVDRERHDLYASLCRALASEEDVFVIYDRRVRAVPSRRRWRRAWAEAEEVEGDRRQRTDVDEAIRERGFGVVHLREDDLEYDDTTYAEE